MQLVVAIVGVSGVGKSTCAAEIAKRTGWQHLSASDLLFGESSNRALSVEATAALSNIDENDLILPKRFETARDATAEVVLIDAHTTVETSNASVAVPSKVFRMLGVSALVFLYARADVILTHRSWEPTRKRLMVSETELERQQQFAAKITRKIGNEIGVPIFSLSFDAYEQIIDCIRDLID